MKTTAEQFSKRLAESVKQAEGHPQHGHLTREAVRAFGRGPVVSLMERAANGDMDWTKLRESVYTAARKGLLREAIAESAFSSLLRLGVENIIAKGWEIPQTVWDQCIMSVPSKGAYGVYGATYRTTMPGEVPAGGEFPELKVLPDEKLLRNKKFGGLLEFERELFDDDQTGEINTKSSEMGEQMQLLKEMWFAAAIQGKSTAVTVGGVKVPGFPYTDPDGNSGVYSVARGNRPSAFKALTMQSFTDARQALLTIKDPLGNVVGGVPDTLVVAPNMEMAANLLMNSSWTPTNVGASGTPSFPTDHNPIKGMAKVQVCVYLPDNFWCLMRAKKRSLIMQPRQPLWVTQEDPNSGKSFDRYMYRFQAGERWAMGWLLGGVRHAYLGNDGTIPQPSLTPTA